MGRQGDSNWLKHHFISFYSQFSSLNWSCDFKCFSSYIKVCNNKIYAYESPKLYLTEWLINQVQVQVPEAPSNNYLNRIKIFFQFFKNVWFQWFCATKGKAMAGLERNLWSGSDPEQKRRFCSFPKYFHSKWILLWFICLLFVYLCLYCVFVFLFCATLSGLCCVVFVSRTISLQRS